MGFADKERNPADTMFLPLPEKAMSKTIYIGLLKNYGSFCNIITSRFSMKFCKLGYSAI